MLTSKEEGTRQKELQVQRPWGRNDLGLYKAQQGQCQWLGSRDSWGSYYSAAVSTLPPPLPQGSGACC
ncbi:hypothetical protein J1605_004242 [Eschrichtius robustus]|uniref:Uncharacterized protein n=1 Tax=Eschrichtius robustus TaxID=9764 RepID=A0AB34HJY3_ESCRO|nr:hypothetical protein J1605_004242 [Eschrichtius robustus]